MFIPLPLAILFIIWFVKSKDLFDENDNDSDLDNEPNIDL